MPDLKNISRRYIIFSALCFWLIGLNMIIQDVQTWLIIDIILIIILTNRVIENYRVGHDLNADIMITRRTLRKMTDAASASKYHTVVTSLEKTITYQKISYFFSISICRLSCIVICQHGHWRYSSLVYH